MVFLIKEVGKVVKLCHLKNFLEKSFERSVLGKKYYFNKTFVKGVEATSR